MRAPTVTMKRARVFRRELTLPEVLLWQDLGKKRVDGLRFRMQHAVGSYVLDFYAPAHRLAVEIDGASHDSAERRPRRAARPLAVSAGHPRAAASGNRRPLGRQAGGRAGSHSGYGRPPPLVVPLPREAVEDPPPARRMHERREPAPHQSTAFDAAPRVLPASLRFVTPPASPRSGPARSKAGCGHGGIGRRASLRC